MLNIETRVLMLLLKHKLQNSNGLRKPVPTEMLSGPTAKEIEVQVRNNDYVIREEFVTLSKIKIKLYTLERLDRQ